jgi:hypothetical protein
MTKEDMFFVTIYNILIAKRELSNEDIKEAYHNLK